MKGESYIENLLEILDKFEGMIGVILGTFLGAFIELKLKSIGKLKIYLRGLEKIYISEYKNGICKSQEEYFYEAKNCRLKLEFDIINTSETSKIMRDLKIEVRDGNKREKNLVQDLSSGKSMGPFLEYDELKGLCIQGKEYFNINICSFIFDEIGVNELNNIKLYLTYINEKNKKKKVRIKIEKQKVILQFLTKSVLDTNSTTKV